MAARSGYPGPASTWLSVPEWIVFALGGDPVREPSLASRTGLIDQGTGGVWPDALAAAGLSPRILPTNGALAHRPGTWDTMAHPLCRRRRTDGGRARPSGGGLGVGAVEPDELFNSAGTADVLARSIRGTLDQTQRQRVVKAGWSIGRHVLPDTSLLLAGVSGGLLWARAGRPWIRVRASSGRA